MNTPQQQPPASHLTIRVASALGLSPGLLTVGLLASAWLPETLLPAMARSAWASPSESANTATGSKSVQPAAAQPPAGLTPTTSGAIGLFHAATTDVGPRGHLRLAVRSEYFASDGFLVDHDENRRFVGRLSAGYSLTDWVEAYAQLLAMSNRNSHPGSRSAPAATSAIYALGDLTLGAKGRLALSPLFALGLDIGLHFLNSPQGLSFDGSATSVGFDALASFDGRRLRRRPLPLRAHVTLGYFLDNSDHLVDFSSRTLAQQTVERFAYGIDSSRLRLGLGIDVPLEVGGVGLRPIVEYRLEVVTGAADPRYLDDPRYADSAEARARQLLTLGLRLFPVAGLMLELGVDVGLSSVGLAMGPPTPPYNLLFGIGYAVAPPAAVRHAADEAHDSARQQAAARAAAAVAAASAQPQLRGVVHDAVSGAPIAEAVIRLPGRPENPLLSAADGSFVLVLRTASATLPTLTLEVRRTGYLPSTVAVALAPGSDRQVAIQMQPRPQPGRIQGLVLDASGGPVEARVRFRTGSAEPSVLARGGSFLVQLPAGSYEVEPEAAGFLAQRRRITVEAGQEVVLELRLRRRPRVSGISLAGERIVLRRGLEFEGQGGRLTAGSQAALDEVVDLLLGQPQPGEIWVEKCVGQGEAGMARREQQQLLARAVRDYLIGGGVAEGDVRSREVGPGRASRPATVPGSGRGPLCGVMLRLARPALPEPLLQ